MLEIWRCWRRCLDTNYIKNGPLMLFSTFITPHFLLPSPNRFVTRPLNLFPKKKKLTSHVPIFKLYDILRHLHTHFGEFENLTNRCSTKPILIWFEVPVLCVKCTCHLSWLLFTWLGCLTWQSVRPPAFLPFIMLAL